jgi:carbon monoxide dehydrogenase subunit G
VTAVTASIEIAAPPQAVWDVIMDPKRFGEWVTIHRKLGRVDDGDLREGFRVEQTLCLHHANFKVKWTLAECEEPLHAVWEGRGPAGSHARTVDDLTPLTGVFPFPTSDHRSVWVDVKVPGASSPAR